MAWKECVAAITAAAGRELTDDEVERIAEAVHVRTQAKMMQGMTPRDAAGAAGKELSGEATLAAMLKKRDAANNILRHADRRNEIIPGQEVQTETAWLGGRNGGGSDARNAANSVDANHHSKLVDLVAPAMQKLKDAKLLSAIKGGWLEKRDRALELDVARELGRRDTPDAIPATGNRHAETIASILGDVLEASRAMQNKAGAFIGKLDNYMGRQYHDMWKIRSAGFEAWRDAILPKLDTDKMFPDGATPERINSALRNTYNTLASGVHDAGGNDALKGFQGAANMGKKLSQERSIIFKGPDDWFHYNEQFGKGGVMDAVLSAADSAARNTALMDKFGTNPEAMFDRLHKEMIENAKARGDFAAVDALRSNPNEGMLDVVTGKAAIPGNAKLAMIGANVRQGMQLLHLGQVVTTAITHIPITANVLRHNGVNFWAGFAGQIRALLPYGEHSQVVANALGASIEHDMGAIIRRFRTEDGIPGQLSRAVNVFHKINGFSWLLDRQQQGLALGLSHTLAQYADREFASLEPKFQTSLRRYGIEAAEWDKGRATAQVAADGRSYVLPAHMEDPALRSKFQTYITDQIREGLNAHSVWARSAINLGTQAGTPSGELVRSFLQFKGFALTLMQKQLGRELRRNGIDLPGALYLMVGMTMAGYAGNALRSWVGNKTTSLPTSAEDAAKQLTEAFVRGGAGGLFADALLGHGKSSADVIGALAGPTIGAVTGLIATANNIRMGDANKGRGQIAVKEMQKWLGAQSPNFWATSAAYNYMFPYALRELADPGATQRARRVMRQNGQDFILRP